MHTNYRGIDTTTAQHTAALNSPTDKNKKNLAFFRTTHLIIVIISFYNSKKKINFESLFEFYVFD